MGDRIRMMSSGVEFDVTEVGYFCPGQLMPVNELLTGEVGYIGASIKEVADTRVGDTITNANDPAAETLPGYKQVQPMVFCGIYPADGADYENLHDALEKLKLNDASLSFEPETSVALGFGFRCRLPRSSAHGGHSGAPGARVRPGSDHHRAHLSSIMSSNTTATELYIDNPTNLPDPADIEYMEEPMVSAQIFSPSEYVGTIMELCQQKRGVYIDMKYIEAGRVQIHYEMPLNEIIYDFFDALKSRTRGYASFDYELNGYARSELVKLDILLNGEICDALSIIVHKDRAYASGRAIAEKLKDVIPRQLFEIPIQAAVGGKIIARETVKAMRKDVLAKCYGGDITRKKKLLEKQKEGKKRMRHAGQRRTAAARRSSRCSKRTKIKKAP